MDSKYQPQLVEEKIYKEWEEKGYFLATVNKKKKPFSIILPPPNANADLHLGHAMYVFEDIMIRYHRLLGEESLWLPGADHAGFETQFVFEKHLKKEGKSRFDFDRETLFKMIWEFVLKNRDNMENQLRRLGFALDWKKKKFTMDDDIVKIVYETFEKLHKKGLVYREKRLVNFCTFCGTSFSDLEVIHKEKTSPLYYMKYGPFTLATTRPETKFGDTAVAVNPKDKRYKSWIGKEIEVEGLNGKFKLKVIGDQSVDPKFGTGVVKITPAHDFTDFETGKRHHLEMKQVINFDGKLNELAGPYQGLYVNQARIRVVEDLKKKGLLVKVKEDYQNRVGTCYKCGRVLEPLPKEQWFIRVKPLTAKAKKLVMAEKIKVYPKRFKRVLLWWLDNFRDWNISRQIVWGIRIPAYQCKNSEFRMKNSELGRWFISVETPKKCLICGKCDFEQDTDTFDTWFSSGQWPYATLLAQSENSKFQVQNDFFDYFYPTSVMETGYDILPWWVARMIMLGVFATGKPPFKNIFLHGLVRDKHGQKMSKSKGNVINPMEMVDKYGADALRAALVFGVKEGGDLPFAEEKVVGMRNFCNKIWNIGRFIWMNKSSNLRQSFDKLRMTGNDIKLRMTGNDIKLRMTSGDALRQAQGDTGKVQAQGDTGKVQAQGDKDRYQVQGDKEGYQTQGNKEGNQAKGDRREVQPQSYMGKDQLQGDKKENQHKSDIGINQVYDKKDVMGSQPKSDASVMVSQTNHDNIIKQLNKEFKEEKKKYLKAMKNFKFSQALGLVYEFIWHKFADYYIEQLKQEVINGNIEVSQTLEKVYLENLKMLHPFTPFVTEAVWKVFRGEGQSILEVGFGSEFGK